MFDYQRLRKSVFQTAHSLGVDSQLLSLYNRFADFAEFPVDDDIQAYDGPTEEEREGYVLIPLVQGQTGVNAYRYAIFAHAFRVRGYEPIVVQCDACLPLCHRKQPSWSDDSVCSVCQYYGQGVLEAFGLEAIPLSELVDVKNDAYTVDDDSYRGIETSRFAAASSRKFLKKYHIDRDGDVYRDFHVTAKILVDAIETVVDQYDVRVALAHDDKYVYGGVPLAVAHKHGIPAYSHALGYRVQKILLGKTTNRSSLPWFTDSTVLAERLAEPLTEAQVETIREFMTARSSGGGDSRHHYSATTDISVQSDDERLVGMFTNLIWDASLEHDTAAYPDVFEWIRDTIKYVGGQEGIHLVVKTHPAEAVRGTNESISEWIETNLDVAENVTVLEPDTPVNTYELIDDLDAGIVYNSTVGLEMAFRGLPVLVAGETHYRELDFTFDPETPDAYRALIDDISNLEFTEGMQRRVERYAYFLFYQKHLSFPFQESNESSDSMEPLPVAAEDLDPGVELFDMLVSRCVAGEPIFESKSPDSR